MALQACVKYTRVQESTFLHDLLSWVIPALVFFGVWYLLVRRFGKQGGGLGGGFMAIGKSRAKIYVEKQTGSTSPTWAASTRPRPSCRKWWSS